MDEIKYLDRGRGQGFAVRVGNINVGEIFAVDSGDYMFEPDERRGAFPAWFLRKIADKLDELNAPLALEIQAYFEAQYAESESTTTKLKT